MSKNFVAALLAGTVLAYMAGAGTPARADALSGIVGGYSGTFSNLEDLYNPTSGTLDTALTQGDYDFGVLSVSSLVANNGAEFNAGVGQEGYLVGVFSQIQVGTIGGTTIQNTGGEFSLYLIPESAYSSLAALDQYLAAEGAAGYSAGTCAGQTLATAATASSSSICYAGVTNLGTDVLNLSLVNNGPAPGSTLEITVTAGGDGSPTGGSGQAYADATGGTDAAQFSDPTEINGSGSLADINLRDQWCTTATIGGGCTSPVGANGTTNNWLLTSNDPFEGDAIPEPASLALFGAALLTFGGLYRRKRTKA